MLTLTQLRSFYLHIADTSHTSSTVAADPDEPSESPDFEWVEDRSALSSLIPPAFETTILNPMYS